MRVHKTSRLARLVATVAAGATLLGFGAPAAQADVPTHAYDEAAALADAAATGTTYYVSTSGKNDAAGTSEDAPTTLEQVNKTEFNPGDKILFKAGDTWEATGEANLDYDNPTALLHPLGSGDASAKITLGSYGSVGGSRPVFKGNAKVNDTVQLKDQQYWDISGLDVSNTAEGFTGNDDGGAIDEKNGALVADLRGIHIYGQTKAELTGFNLHDLYVHDVTGEVSWISQDHRHQSFEWGRANMEKQKTGVNMQGGWDFSKRTGGILVETFKPEGEPTIFSDIVVENNDLRQNSFGAFTIKQWYGGSNKYAEWDGRASNGYKSNARMHKNVTIKDNYIDQKGVYNGDGIYLTSVQGSLIEGNVVGYPGVCGIELYFADSVTVQNNEVFESQRKAGGGDSNGIDPDRNCTNIVIQYNYIHDNGDGLLICGYNYNTVIIRYNVLFNNRAKIIRDSVSGGTVDVYNNVFYQGSDIQKPITAGDSPAWVSAGSNGEVWTLKNNIFYYEENSTGNNLTNHTLSAGRNVNYDHNVYYGFTPSTNDDHATVLSGGDALFQDTLKEHAYPTSLAERVSAFDALKLANAQVNDSGVAYEWNKELSSEDTIFGLDDSMSKDYAGTVIDTNPDPGILETEFTGVGGTLTDAYGSAIAGAKVTFTKDGKEYTATTTGTGYYHLQNATAGDYAVTVTDAEGKKLYSGTVTVGSSYTAHDLSAHAADNGSVSGVVKGIDGKPVAEATVTLRIGARSFETQANVSGAYTFNNVPVSTDDMKYTLAVTKDGFAAGSLEGIEVKANETTQVKDVALAKITAFELGVDAKGKSDDITLRSVTDGAFSGGAWTAVESVKEGSYAEYEFDVAEEGVYDLVVFTKDKPNGRATTMTMIDGKWVGGQMVMSRTALEGRASYGIGAMHLTKGKHTIRFTVVDTAKGNLFGLDSVSLIQHVDTADGFTTESKETFDQQTDPQNYGFAQYATVYNGLLRIEGMPSGSVVTTTLPFTKTDGKAPTKAGVRFLWSGATSGGDKAGVQLKDDQGHLVFALTSAKGNEVRYGTAFKDGKISVEDAKAFEYNNEPQWTIIGADPTKLYSVSVTADFDTKKVHYSVTEIGGTTIIEGDATTDATSLERLLLANYYGSGNKQTLDDIELRVAKPGDKTELKAALAAIEAERLDADDYTFLSWKTFSDALADAKAVAEKQNATQDEVNAALKTLKDAREALVKRPTSGGGTTVITKKQVSITGVTAADAWFDGRAHVGFEGTPSSDFKGTYEVTYRGSGSTTYGPSKDAPTAAGTYRVTVSVPESDPTWYGSLALEFSIRSGSTVVGRFYTSGQGAQGLHMWTASDAESGALGASGWNREGDAFVMDAHAGDPVYRLYDPRGNQHLWTTSKDERDHLVGQQGWNDEGIAFYQNPAATVDVYRLYNPWTGEHLWTTSGLERDSLTALSNGAWSYEGVAFKAMAK